MKKVLIILSIILFFVSLGAIGYGVYRKKVTEREAEEYNSLVSRIIEKHGEDGVIAMAILERIYILEELGRQKEIIQEAQKLLQMDLDYELNSDAIWRLVDYYGEVGERDQLISELKGVYASTQDPKTRLEALLAIVNFYKENGEYEKAIEILDEIEKG